MKLPKPADNLRFFHFIVLRQVIAAALPLALLVATAACGRGSPPPAPPPVRTSSPPTAAALSSPEEARAPVVYQSRGRRDPFTQPQARAAQEEPMAHLKVTGIVWGPRSYYALVESDSPPGMGYIIRENDVVNSARVLKITKENVIFEVRVKSADGKSLTRYVQKRIRQVESR